MAAVNITTGNGDNNFIRNGARVIVRNSNGIPYVVVFNDTDNQIDVWKGNGTTPTSFSEPDAGNGPADANYYAPSAAIDSSDVIHIAYLDLDTAKNGGGLRYVQFRADGVNDDFVNDASKLTWSESPPSGTARTHTAVAIDSNGKVHIVFIEGITNMGSNWETVMYTNDVAAAGTFKAAVEVEGQAAERTCTHSNITIDADDKPCISYFNQTDDDVGSAQGDANNATAFTLFDIYDHAGLNPNNAVIFYTSIAVDSSGNHYISYISAGTGQAHGDLYIRKHSYGVVWATWVAAEAIETSGISVKPSLVINGTDRYIFVEDSGGDIHYWYDMGSGWTDGGDLETGTYNTPKAKWAYSVDNDSTGANRGGGGSRAELDYIFTDETGTPDILFNSLSLVAAGPAGIKTINDTAIASVKTINDEPIAEVKTINDAS